MMRYILIYSTVLVAFSMAACTHNRQLKHAKAASNARDGLHKKPEPQSLNENQLNFNVAPPYRQHDGAAQSGRRSKNVLRENGNAVLTGEQLEAMPVFNQGDQLSTQPSILQNRNGGALTSGGGRTTGQTYIVDGIVTGQAPAPAAAEGYEKIHENDFRAVSTSPLSTMSVDVDRAAYSNVRRYLNAGRKPPADAVRIEEMVNYFDYDYPQPTGEDPIAIVTELAACPWNKDHQLLHVGLRAKRINTAQLPASNLVFLIDVSGSMQEPAKLPLVKSSLTLLVNTLRPQDRVAIVVYAGAAGLVLPSTSAADKASIIAALDKLEAGGSTAGGAGIELAYKTALEHFIKGGNNRVILATDGDFNVGISAENDLEDLIVRQRQKGVFLSVLGYGTGNYQDGKMQLLADKGNGNHGYIDNMQEAQKMLVSEFGGTLFTVAKDVKAQIEFNPALVQAYRLIGYENRLLNNEDFRDDTKDAAEMGAGHAVTILYEIIPAGAKSRFVPKTDSLRYSQAVSTQSDELAAVRFRYKQPDDSISREMLHPIGSKGVAIAQASGNLRFSAAVALFGMLLRSSGYSNGMNYDAVVALAEAARGADQGGYRAEFIRLVKTAR